MKKRNKKKRENLEKELENLYREKIRMAMEASETFGDNFVPVITVVDVERNEYHIPMVGPIDSTDAEIKENVEKEVNKLLKKKPALAIIAIGEGRAVEFDEREQLLPVPLKDQPNEVEIFYALIHSVVLKKMRMWTIKRDGKGNRIYPLEERLLQPGDFRGLYTGPHSEVS